MNLEVADKGELQASKVCLPLMNIEFHSLHGLCYHFLDLYKVKEWTCKYLADVKKDLTRGTPNALCYAAYIETELMEARVTRMLIGRKLQPLVETHDSL